MLNPINRNKAKNVYSVVGFIFYKKAHADHSPLVLPGENPGKGQRDTILSKIKIGADVFPVNIIFRPNNCAKIKKPPAGPPRSGGPNSANE
jgi:hypothetical protein